jgi:GrpB-like predicted nucleotidyltransferase (UPF0157 family)
MDGGPVRQRLPWKRFVKVVPYRPKWAEYFRKEKELLLKIMGEKVLAVRHIGSTSIVGMPAKPISDILVGLQTLAAVEPFVEDLNLIGYEDRGNGDDLGRRYFVKGAEEKEDTSSEFLRTVRLFLEEAPTLSRLP